SDSQESIADIISARQHMPGALLPILHGIQDALGHVPANSVPAIAQAALASGVPVLANAASHAAAGALISLGADYFEVGRATGNVAAEILKGRAPDSFPVENVVPQRLVLNLDVLPLLREPWDIPEEDFVAAVEAACREMGPARRAPPRCASCITPNQCLPRTARRGFWRSWAGSGSSAAATTSLK
ncbi:MAG: ABC transporter substrate binding protein, partial [Kiritimatiellia bacterium]